LKRGALLLAAAVVAAGFAVVWLLRPADSGLQAEKASKAALSELVRQVPDVVASTQSRPPEAEVVAAEGDWRTLLDEMMQREVPNDDLAVEYAEILPTLPPEGQAEAAWRMAAMLPDELYHYATRMYVDPSTPPEVVAAIHENLLLRGDDTKLHVLAEVLGNPEHRFREEARRELREILEVDHGYSVRRWADEVDNFLDPEPAQEED
jgi:hypothetical protein